MLVQKIFVFKTPFYEPRYKEFNNLYDLKFFLQNFDFMKPHKKSIFPTGMPEFQLGMKVSIGIDTNLYESSITWGPKFIVGRKIRVVDKKISVCVPMDKICCDDKDIVEREYKYVKLNVGTANAVIDLKNFYQLWPICHNKSDTELSKFLAFVAKKRYRFYNRTKVY